MASTRALHYQLLFLLQEALQAGSTKTPGASTWVPFPGLLSLLPLSIQGSLGDF